MRRLQDCRDSAAQALRPNRREFLAGLGATAVGALGLAAVGADDTAAGAPAASGGNPKGSQTDYLATVCSHLGKIITQGTDRYGSTPTAMWMASLDTRTGAYPEGQPHAKAGKRCYRDIDSPNGCTIYWDQPELVAAYALSSAGGDARYAQASDAYVRAFLDRCVASDGLFEWGNHIFYDAYADKVMHFSGGPHEMRPIPPAWAIFWRIAPEVTEREIRRAAERHLFDPATGGFNRHADGKKGCAFLESGGILAESLAWLYAKKKDASLAETALKIARYSFSNRSAETGLVENNPTVTRWDKFVCTTEIGLWAGSLLHAADYTGNAEFQEMARAAVAAYLKYGYDASKRRYYGQVRVKDGTPVLDAKGENEPGPYADVWNAFFPTHDYPVALGEACLALYRRTKGPEFAEAVHRMAQILRECPPPSTARNGRGAYAELFGRSIHFLAGAAETFPDKGYAAQATALAEAAVSMLFAHGMFRTHAGEDRYDSVDGAGYLLLALQRLALGRDPDLMGFGF